jgi:hypothetical protein
MENRAMNEAPQVEHRQRAVHVGRGGQSRSVIHLAVVKHQQHHHHRRRSVLPLTGSMLPCSAPSFYIRVDDGTPPVGGWFIDEGLSWRIVL